MFNLLTAVNIHRNVQILWTLWRFACFGIDQSLCFLNKICVAFRILWLEFWMRIISLVLQNLLREFIYEWSWELDLILFVMIKQTWSKASTDVCLAASFTISWPRTNPCSILHTPFAISLYLSMLASSERITNKKKSVDNQMAKLCENKRHENTNRLRHISDWVRAFFASSEGYCHRVEFHSFWI